MSTINKKPYIQSVLESLTQDNLTSLIGLVNGGEGAQIFRSFINTSYNLTTDDEGIKRIVLEAKDEVYTGYLIFTDTYCVVVAYNGPLSQKLKVLVLDYEADTYEIVDEELSIEEFRRLIEGRTTNLIVQANDVVANPTLAGTEDVLTGLQVDGTKYAVPQGGGSGGSSLHCLKLMFSDDDTGKQTECTMYLPFEKPDDFDVDPDHLEEPFNLGTKTFLTNLYNLASDYEYPRFPINDNTYFGMYVLEKTLNTFIIETYFTDYQGNQNSIRFIFNVSNGEVVSLKDVKVDNVSVTTAYIYLYQFF